MHWKSRRWRRKKDSWGKIYDEEKGRCGYRHLISPLVSPYICVRVRLCPSLSFLDHVLLIRVTWSHRGEEKDRKERAVEDHERLMTIDYITNSQ